MTLTQMQSKSFSGCYASRGASYTYTGTPESEARQFSYSPSAQHAVTMEETTPRSGGIGGEVVNEHLGNGP